MMKSQNGQEVHLSPMHSDADMDKNRKKITLSNGIFRFEIRIYGL